MKQTVAQTIDALVNPVLIMHTICFVNAAQLCSLAHKLRDNLIHLILHKLGHNISPETQFISGQKTPKTTSDFATATAKTKIKTLDIVIVSFFSKVSGSHFHYIAHLPDFAITAWVIFVLQIQSINLQGCAPPMLHK